MTEIKGAPQNVFIENLMSPLLGSNENIIGCKHCDRQATHSMMACWPDPPEVVTALVWWMMKQMREENIRQDIGLWYIKAIATPHSFFQWHNTFYLCSGCLDDLKGGLLDLSQYDY